MFQDVHLLPAGSNIEEELQIPLAAQIIWVQVYLPSHYQSVSLRLVASAYQSFRLGFALEVMVVVALDRGLSTGCEIDVPAAEHRHCYACSGFSLQRFNTSYLTDRSQWTKHITA